MADMKIGIIGAGGLQRGFLLGGHAGGADDMGDARVHG